MSVRIHQLSKQIGLENKELISLLQERGFPVTSASSSIDNISAESLVDEFKSKEQKESAKTAAAETKAKTAGKPTAAETKKEAKDESDGKPSIQLPPGVFVKSAEDVQREREEKAAAAEAAKAPARPAARTAPPIQREIGRASCRERE